MGMVTVIAIILADLLVFLLYVYQYRQEFGLTVNGSHDLPGLRKKPASKAVTRTGAAGGQANRGQKVVARRGRGGKGAPGKWGSSAAAKWGARCSKAGSASAAIRPPTLGSDPAPR